MLYVPAARRKSKYKSMTVDYTPSGPFVHGLMHLIRDETGHSLENLGRSLASRYPWPLRDAAWFVITGEAPEVEALDVMSNPANGTYSITLAPWISEETLRRTYRSLHENDNRPLGRKILAAFRFVDERTEPGRTPRWAQLSREWNARNRGPGETFWDGSALKRTYERAETRLASPWANEQR